MHHAYPLRYRVARARDAGLPVPYENVAGIGAIKAMEGFHEGAFARTVLAYEGQYLAFAEIEAYLVVGHDTGKALVMPSIRRRTEPETPPVPVGAAAVASFVGILCSLERSRKSATIETGTAFYQTKKGP